MWHRALSDIVWWFSNVGISWYWLAVVLLVDGLQSLKNVTGESFSSVAGILDWHPDLIFYLIVWLLCHIIFWFYLRSVDDTRVYTFICKCVQTSVICWAEMRQKCHVVHHYACYKCVLIFTVEWFCKWCWT